MITPDERVAQKRRSKVSALAEVGIMLELLHDQYGTFKDLLAIHSDPDHGPSVRWQAQGKAVIIGLLEKRFMTLYREEANERERERFCLLFNKLTPRE